MSRNLGTAKRNPARRTSCARVCALSVLAVSLAGCATGKFRYDRLREKRDNVEMKDLEELLADGQAGPLQRDDLKVEQIEYDFKNERDEYRLGKNDVLNIFVLDHPELSSQRVNLGEISGTTIRKDGKVHLPVVGGVQAEGLTLTEFETALRDQVAKYVIEPHVAVEILRHESQKFFVLGEVRQPGAFPVNGQVTLLEGLGVAGGILPTADLEGAIVIRDAKLMPINLADVVRRGDVTRNVFLRHGDLVYVPDNVAKKVFVLGEVQQPNAVPIERDHVSLAEALSLCGGPTPARARRELAIIRGGFAKPVVYIVELEKALLYDDQIKLRAGDRVVVAPTGLSTASRYMQQVLPFLQGLQAAGIAAQGGTNVANQITAIQAQAASQ